MHDQLIARAPSAVTAEGRRAKSDAQGAENAADPMDRENVPKSSILRRNLINACGIETDPPPAMPISTPTGPMKPEAGVRTGQTGDGAGHRADRLGLPKRSHSKPAQVKLAAAADEWTCNGHPRRIGGRARRR